MTQDPASAASPAAIAPGAAAPTVGSALRALRQAKGWSLEEVSSRIKFSTRMIQALEEERWESLPAHQPGLGVAADRIEGVADERPAVAHDVADQGDQRDRVLGETDQRVGDVALQGNGDFSYGGDAHGYWIGRVTGR